MLPLRRRSVLDCCVFVVDCEPFHISSIPREPDNVPGDTERGDPVVLFVAVVSCDLSSMFMFVNAAALAGISFCVLVVVIKTCSSSFVVVVFGSMRKVYCLTNGP